MGRCRVFYRLMYIRTSLVILALNESVFSFLQNVFVISSESLVCFPYLPVLLYLLSTPEWPGCAYRERRGLADFLQVALREVCLFLLGFVCFA